MWLALVKPSKGLFISREANCMEKKGKSGSGGAAEQRRENSCALKFGDNKFKARMGLVQKLGEQYSNKI